MNSRKHSFRLLVATACLAITLPTVSRAEPAADRPAQMTDGRHEYEGCTKPVRLTDIQKSHLSEKLDTLYEANKQLFEAYVSYGALSKEEKDLKLTRMAAYIQSVKKSDYRACVEVEDQEIEYEMSFSMRPDRKDDGKNRNGDDRDEREYERGDKDSRDDDLDDRREGERENDREQEGEDKDTMALFEPTLDAADSEASAVREKDNEQNCTHPVAFSPQTKKQLRGIYWHIYKDYTDLINTYAKAGALSADQANLRKRMLKNYINTFYQRSYRWCSEHESDEWEEEWFNSDKDD